MAHIFISYSHKDTDYAHKLASALQNKGLEVWIDERLDYGSQWPHEIQRQLDSCSAFILIMSPRSFASEWVQSELQRAKRKLKPVFPMLLEGDEPWLSVESTQYYDVRGNKLPDEKFFGALKRFASVQATEAGPAPSRPKGALTLNVPKLKTRYIIAVAGGLITIFIALFILSLRRNLSSPTHESSAATLGQLYTAAAQTLEEMAAQANTATDTPSPTDFPFTSPTNLSSSPMTQSGQQGFTPTEINTPSITNLPQEITDDFGVKMVLIPAGDFIMGSNTSSYNEDRPAHTVYLNDYYIDTYEVTNARYASCVDAGICQPPQETSSATRSRYYGEPEFDDYPVIYVDWDMAVTYCEWREAHLPTEAQWEKAARGTDGRSYPWGEGIDAIYANYNYNIGDTTVVGNYDAGTSPYGLYDMSGNVWEWVADWFSESYYQASPSSNPTGPGGGQFHGLRGGSWANEDKFVHTYTRGWNQLEYFQYVDFGFRCARETAP